MILPELSKLSRERHGGQRARPSWLKAPRVTGKARPHLQVKLSAPAVRAAMARAGSADFDAEPAPPRSGSQLPQSRSPRLETVVVDGETFRPQR